MTNSSTIQRADPAPLLDIVNLSVAFQRDGQTIRVLRDVSFQVPCGGRVALVGESGCGKSMTCMALTRLPPVDGAATAGAVRLAGQNLLRIAGRDLRAVRRDGIAYIFQDPAGSLNPVMKISAHLRESLPRTPHNGRRTAALRALLSSVGLPPDRLDAYPCELSGGQQQRVMIAMALAARPRLVVADEPTTALDVCAQRRVLEQIDAMCRQCDAGWLLVTHNLGVAAAHARTLVVMYAGQVVETGPVPAVLRHPFHPYTRGLIRAVPSLRRAAGPWRDIPGEVPAAGAEFAGCPFAPRCRRVLARCTATPVPMWTPAPGRQVRCLDPLTPTRNPSNGNRRD